MRHDEQKQRQIKRRGQRGSQPNRGRAQTHRNDGRRGRMLQLRVTIAPMRMQSHPCRERSRGSRRVSRRGVVSASGAAQSQQEGAEGRAEGVSAKQCATSKGVTGCESEARSDESERAEQRGREDASGGWGGGGAGWGGVGWGGGERCAEGRGPRCGSNNISSSLQLPLRRPRSFRPLCRRPQPSSSWRRRCPR